MDGIIMFTPAPFELSSSCGKFVTTPTKLYNQGVGLDPLNIMLGFFILPSVGVYLTLYIRIALDPFALNISANIISLLGKVINLSFKSCGILLFSVKDLGFNLSASLKRILYWTAVAFCTINLECMSAIKLLFQGH